MKLTNFKRIATTSLVMLLLHGNSMAEPAIGIRRPEAAASAISARKTVPCFRHRAITAGHQSAGQPAPSHQYHAGENSFTTGDNWFRD